MAVLHVSHFQTHFKVCDSTIYSADRYHEKLFQNIYNRAIVIELCQNKLTVDVQILFKQKNGKMINCRHFSLK